MTHTALQKGVMFDITPFLKADDPWPASEEHGQVLAYYAAKYHVAALLRPETILEIGVRAGYSAAAFLSACPRASYTGIDANVAAHGGMAGLFDWARETLPARFPTARFVFHQLDTRVLERLPGGRYDLIHVDGDHSRAGCLHDLQLAAQSGRWVLVDDVTWIPEVGGAVEEFLQERGLPAVVLPTWRGDALIQVGPCERVGS